MAILEGVFWAILALGVVAAGWLYPVWFLGRDSVMREDTDLRLGAARGMALWFCLLSGFVLAVLAIRSFRRARDPHSPAVANATTLQKD